MIQRDTTYRLLQETQMILYTKRVQDACDPFSCGNGKEDEEREYYHIPEDEPIHTRLMYFDLKKL